MGLGYILKMGNDVTERDMGIAHVKGWHVPVVE